jgi:hypothetical protein
MNSHVNRTASGFRLVFTRQKTDTSAYQLYCPVCVIHYHSQHFFWTLLNSPYNTINRQFICHFNCGTSKLIFLRFYRHTIIFLEALYIYGSHHISGAPCIQFESRMLADSVAWVQTHETIHIYEETCAGARLSQSTSSVYIPLSKT